MLTENDLETNVTRLTVQFSKGGAKHITEINERPQVEPEYCRICGGIENLYTVFPNSSVPAMYGCECL